MLHDRDKRIIEDILDDISVINSAIAGMKKRDFLSNRIIQASVERKIEIICDSCSNLSTEVKMRLPVIDWDDIRALRNELAHDYRDISPKAMWDAAVRTIPILENQLKKLL